MDNLTRPAQLTPENAAAFSLAGVVDAYHLRTPYPRGLAPLLSRLMTAPGGRVLELGCGTGEIARMLAPDAGGVDAIDISDAMLNRARMLPGGDDPCIRWTLGRAEEVAFDPPYAIGVAGDSLHWMNWEVVLPRVGRALAPRAHLAIVTAVALQQPWLPDLKGIIQTYSVMQDFEAYDLVHELERRRLFVPSGRETVTAEPFTRTVAEYIEGLHATAGFPRDRMPPDHARAFDDGVRRLVEPYSSAGLLELSGSADVTWGTPSR